MAKILVTGGTGYIGSHTVVELQDAGFYVYMVDNLSNSEEKVVDRIKHITGIRPGFKQVDCVDYNALESVFKMNNGFDAVINFTANKVVGKSVKNPLPEILT